MYSADKSGDVVITGLGLVTPLGSSVAAFDTALRSGRSALVPDPSLSKRLPNLQPAEPALARIGDFGAAAAIDAGRRRRMPRIGQLAVVAAQQALGLPVPLPAGVAPPPSAVTDYYGRDRVGVVLGTGLGALDTTIDFTAQYIEGGLGMASPALFPYTVMNTASALVAMELGLLGPNITINHRDLSSLEAVASGCDLLACDRLDAVLVGGCDELGPWLLHAYARLGALPEPGRMLPYSKQRCGFSPGEGAVLLLLERESAATARGATILARIAGIGRAGDDRPRLGWQRPAEPAAVSGAADSVRLCLAEAGVLPTAIDYIAGSGNGTGLDHLETAALRLGLGAAAEQVAISSVLGLTGEWFTSAGVRLAAALYALSAQRLPAMSCPDPDPQAALPGLCLVPQAATVNQVLVPTFGQGGGSVSLLLSRPS